jgi:hypothetical protein
MGVEVEVGVAVGSDIEVDVGVAVQVGIGVAVETLIFTGTDVGAGGVDIQANNTTATVHNPKTALAELDIRTSANLTVRAGQNPE